MERLIKFICNSELISIKINPAETVLDFLRHNRKLTGTKEGCREGDCGACTVIIGSLHKGNVSYKTVNSCLLPVADLQGKHLVSIEGLNGSELNYIQEQMIDEGGTQCGFCTPGFIISLTNYFINNREYSSEEAAASLDGNICRCTGYAGIIRAAANTVNSLHDYKIPGTGAVPFLVDRKILPGYFLEIPKKLKALQKELSDGKPASSSDVVSGGTDLYVQHWETMLEKEINFISENPDLKFIIRKNNRIHIGGAVTVSEICSSKEIIKYYPQLGNYLKYFGSMPIRNRATVAGNIVNASPIADLVNIFIALDAEIHLTSKRRVRTIPIKNFYKAYKTLDKKQDEIVKEISLPVPTKNLLFNYEKVSRRTHLDIASVNSSIALKYEKSKIKDASISAGGVAPVPLFLKSTSEYLTGKEVNNNLLIEAVKIAGSEISPITDARGSKEYKSLLLGQLIKAHFFKFFPDLINDEVLR